MIFAMKSPNAKDKTTMAAREAAVLIEDLHGQFKIFGGGLDGLREKVEGINDALGSTMERMTNIELRLTRLETKQ
jgi:hypothetical protein